MDVLDDGSFELTELMQPTLSTFVQLGPTPVPIRCQLGLELAVPGASLATFTWKLRPADTLVNQWARSTRNTAVRRCRNSLGRATPCGVPAT